MEEVDVKLCLKTKRNTKKVIVKQPKRFYPSFLCTV